MGPLREPSHSVQKTVEGLRGNFMYVLLHPFPSGHSSFVSVLSPPLLPGPSLQAPCLLATRNKRTSPSSPQNLTDTTRKKNRRIIHNCIEFAALTFLLYDHLITFAEEVTYIWARLKHASAILFLVNRYLGCLSTIAQTVISLATISPEVRNFSSSEVHTVHPLPTSIALRESRSRVHAFHSSHVCALWQK
ncbi:hypothetical protein EDD16DRAFT_1179901 [Pisolithus croceorrhizus]|nr:hypothetical protein EDD16DRAFT_1179901 [Pisolithus croceorrhizus]